MTSFRTIISFFILQFIAFCLEAQSKISIIPQPKSMVEKKGVCRIQKQGFEKHIHYKKDKNVRPEGYHLIIQKKKIIIKSSDESGAFYAKQTLHQLLRNNNSLPCLEIKDEPTFAYRGMMLDVARHFMPLQDIKQLIEVLAMHKINRFHWHLTDSQGWRFESKKYPKLTEIGAFRKGTPLNTTYDYDSRPDEKRYGGFYTQDEMREVVAYAKKFHIEVIPEIEMPAHSRSALASYPELLCVDSLGNPAGNPSLVTDDSYCTKEATFTFLKAIFEEVIAIFPSQYIHIAGDEAPKQHWKRCPHCQKRMATEGLKNVEELQSYFIKRIEKIINEQGRSVIGWDEILEGGLAPNATVMSWRGMQGGIDAAKQKHQVIMTPESHCYLNFYQSDEADEPTAFNAHSHLKKTFEFNPIPPQLNSEEAKYIIGAQANLWTEYISDMPLAQYMLFPRLTALSEIFWNNPKERDYETFLRKLEVFNQSLIEKGVKICPHRCDLSLQTISNQKNYQISVSGAFSYDTIRYTLDGNMPTRQSKIYTQPIDIHNNTHFTAAVLLPDGTIRDKATKVIFLHEGIKAKTALSEAPSPYYNKGGERAFVNGILGKDNDFHDKEWLGWSDKTVEIGFEFEAIKTLNQLKTRFFHKPESWIWFPKQVEVFSSEDGLTFTSIWSKQFEKPNEINAIPVEIKLNNLKAKYLKIKLVPYGTIPQNYNGAGYGAWMFLDEIVVE